MTAGRDDIKPIRRSRRLFVTAFVLVLIFGFGLPAAWNVYVASLGPLDLSAVTENSTVVVDRDNHLLRAFTTADGRWRLPATTADVDPRFVAMLEAYEDRRFASHDGVDAKALLRAAGQFLRHGHVVSGGSTLTMQVARLIEPRDDRTLAAKMRQIVRALQLEQRFSKAQILDLYFSLAPYGGNLEGIRAASLSYFGKEPRRLSIAEAALLVALPQGPESRRPDRAPERARATRDRVIDRAVQRSVISAADGAGAKADPVPHQRRPFPSLAAQATEAAARATPDQRIIKLSLDARLQTSFEQLARDNAERIGPKISVAIVAIDNSTGQILAHVGGADYFSQDRSGAIDLTEALRSPGSALKPFIYALAFENGIAHPETILEDRPARFGIYAPKNFDLTYQGQVTARQALQWSLNIPAVELLDAVGPDRFLARLKNAGANIVVSGDAAPGLAVGLGGLGIRLMDMTRLYAGLARGGKVPDLVERLDLPRPAPQDRRITEPVAAWYIFDVLRESPPPTNATTGQIAFKTGTSYGGRDAFAVGYDARVTIGVWVGRADNGAVPGLVGREAAAPILFDAFARFGGHIEPIPAPANVLYATTNTLPAPLKQLRKDVPKTVIATNVASLKIAYPPDGARVDLGLSGGGDSSLALKAQGGVLPLTWMVNGVPVGPPDLRRQSRWQPDGSGFARVSVMDAKGAIDSVVVRVE